MFRNETGQISQVRNALTCVRWLCPRPNMLIWHKTSRSPVLPSVSYKKNPTEPYFGISLIKHTCILKLHDCISSFYICSEVFVRLHNLTFLILGLYMSFSKTAKIPSLRASQDSIALSWLSRLILSIKRNS